MSLDTYSEHRFCTGVEDADGRLYLTPRVPFPYVSRPDNIEHTVKQGDTFWGLASVYYRPRPYAWKLWKIAADFQPRDGVIVHDPTVALPAGKTVFLPSLRTVETEILNEARRAEHDV